MLIPLRHENMQGRRWPVITIGLMPLTVLIFLVPIGRWTRRPGAGEVRVHILLLAAMHPNSRLTAKPKTCHHGPNKNPGLWKVAQIK